MRYIRQSAFGIGVFPRVFEDDLAPVRTGSKFFVKKSGRPCQTVSLWVVIRRWDMKSMRIFGVDGNSLEFYKKLILKLFLKHGTSGTKKNYA